MEKTIDRVIQIGTVIALIVLFSLFLSVKSGNKIFGSISDSSSSYESTTTRTSFDGTAITATGASPKTLSVGFGSLGSVVLTGTSAGDITLYDATTSGAHSDYVGTTTLASIPASAAAGTYIFDVKYTKGLMLVLSGTIGTSTITWKK